MSTTNRGKFSERIKKILFNKKKKKVKNDNFKNIKNDTNYIENIKIEDSKEIYNNFIKVVSAIPLIVHENVVLDNMQDKNNNINHVKELNKIDDKNEFYIGKNDLSFTSSTDNKTSSNDVDFLLEEKSVTLKFNDSINKGINQNENNRDIVNNIDIDEIKEKQDAFYKYSNSENVDNDKVKKLEKSIINLIKKDLIKIVNEMEILQSELYILSEVNGKNRVLKDCQRELDEVKSIICKIDKLKEQYDFLRDNYDFEYLLEIDNHDLVDKIIELRDSFGKNEVKAVSEDYKLLDAFKYLYLKLDKLQDKTLEFEDKKKEEELKLKERDIDFDKLKQEVYNVDYTNRNYDSFVNSQNVILRELDDKVSKISSYEQVDYHLKGFNELFKNSFKYFGLLMVSPLKGVLPAIATETLITGNLIKNLYNNLEWEESKKMIYEAIDYSNIISNAINDLDNTNRIVDMTLDDIVQLKMKYNDKFRMYQGDFLEYREVMQKINDMENKILGNKMKIEMMRKKALEQQMRNSKKLKLVKELNER